MKLVSLLVLALVGCSMTSVRAARVEADDGLALPPARGPLEIAAGAEELNMHELVLALARITGVELALDPLTQQELQQSRVALVRDAPVPAEEAYAFVESFLARQGYALCVLKHGARPILGVFGQASRQSSTPEPLFVAESDLPLLEDHAALLVRVVVTFRNIDTRQLQTQLRQLLVDATGLRQCVPAGERSLILQGLGRETLSLVQLLREVDAASVAPSAPAPAPEAK